MRLLLQRVSEAEVRVADQTVGQIGRGYLLLVGISPDDNQTIAEQMAAKIANLRLFPDEQGRFDRSLLQVQGEALVVSQFTLFGDARKGRRPNFTAAAPPQLAAPLCDHFAQALREQGVTNVQTGQFGASMDVRLHNDGPVTLWLDSAEHVAK